MPPAVAAAAVSAVGMMASQGIKTVQENKAQRQAIEAEKRLTEDDSDFSGELANDAKNSDILNLAKGPVIFNKNKKFNSYGV